MYIKDKNRDDLYYGVCEGKRQKDTKCTARATTICIGNQHKIKKNFKRQKEKKIYTGIEKKEKN